MSTPKWVGKTLGGRYQIEQLLGQGGMSAVYKATDPNLSRPVAVKLIHPHLSEVAEFIGRFREEATSVAQLRHPNIVQVFDFNRDGDDFYMVMEFVGGETLRDRLDRYKAAGRPVPLVEAMKYAINVCDAADYAHQRKLIHRDIKPANVMVDSQGQAILMDFGIAKIVGGAQYTATGATIGTALYMSPEQIRGEQVDKRSDIYAIGVMLFEMICGRPPFVADSPMSLIMMHLGEPVPDISRLRPDCPVELKQVVEKALAKDRDQRYQRAAEMSAALRRASAALKASLQAPTAAGDAAMAATAPPRRAAEVTAAPRRPAVPAGQTTATPPAAGPEAQPATAAAATPAEDYTLPQVVSGGGSRRKLFIAGGLLMIGACALIGGLILILSVLNQSDDEGGPTTAAVALTAPASGEAAGTTAPTATPTQAPTLSPTDTPAPTNTPEPTATPTPRRLGLMSFVDNEQARAGTFQVTLAEAGAPTAGSHYTLWMSDGLSTVFLGEVPPGSGIDLSGEEDVNLLAAFDRAFITIEADEQDNGSPTGEPVFLGFVDPAALEQIRLLVAATADAPGGQGYLVGAEGQALVAIDHGGFLSDSLAAGDLATARQHAEHVVNILSGSESPAFGDLDGDGLAQNPGDGFGVVVYLEKAREHAQLAAEAEGASDEVKVHAEHTLIGLDNAIASVEAAVQAAGRVLASDSVAEAQQGADLLSSTLDALLNGSDANNDGVITPSPGEGGILIAYEHALKMGSFEFFDAQEVTFDDQ